MIDLLNRILEKRDKEVNKHIKQMLKTAKTLRKGTTTLIGDMRDIYPKLSKK